MRKITAVILIATAIAVAGCAREMRSRIDKQSQGVLLANQGAGAAQEQEAAPQKVSLDSAAQASAQITERKIIRNAELTIEVSDPGVGLQMIATIAETNGGFVVTSESRENNSQNLPSRIVTVVARVPAAQFGQAIEAIRRIDGRITTEKISGNDVTEEYIDLEARIRTKRALELQILEIMRQARKISDALEVQSQLAEVRTEIENLEGRRRFLENKSALSTISVTLQTPAPLLAATITDFQQSVKIAFGDGLDTASEIVLGIIRFVIVMVPITLFILVPGWLLFKWLRRYLPLPKSTVPAVIATDQAE
jgi:hypothetical protein